MGIGIAVVDDAAANEPAPRLVRRRRLSAPAGLRRLLGPVLLIGGWQVASWLGMLDERTLAGPLDVLDTFADLVSSGELQRHMWTSLQRVAFGLAFGVGAGLVLAVVSGLWRIGEDVIDGPMQMLRALPVPALVPLIVLWFGIGEQPKIALIAIGTAFPIYLNTYAAIRGVDERMVEAGMVFGLSRRGLVRHVVLPGALPGFLVGLRYSLAVAWLALVISEQINATEGLGYMMLRAREFLQTDVIVVGLLVYASLGLLCDLVVRTLERRMLVWRRGFSGR